MTRTYEAVDAKICRFYTDADISQGNSMRRVIVRRSSVHGKGVFAMRPLAAGERVLEYKGEITAWCDAVRRHRREGVVGHTSLFGLSDVRVIDGRRGGSRPVKNLLNICWPLTIVWMKTFGRSTHAGAPQRTVVTRCWRARREQGAQEGEGSIAIPKNGHRPKQPCGRRNGGADFFRQEFDNDVKKAILASTDTETLI